MARTKRITAVVWNGKTYTPITDSGEITLGGKQSGDGEMDEAGRRYSSMTTMPGKVKMKLPTTEAWSVDDFRGVTADVQVLSDLGESYLVANAEVTSDLTVTSGANSIEIEFTGDAATVF